MYINTIFNFYLEKVKMTEATYITKQMLFYIIHFKLSEITEERTKKHF